MTFLRALWFEFEPILRHFVSAASIGLFALGLRLLQMVAPPDYLNELTFIDHVLVIVLLWLFAGFTVTLLFIRLSKSIYHSASKGAELQSTATPSQVSANDPSALGAGDPAAADELEKQTVASEDPKAPQ